MGGARSLLVIGLLAAAAATAHATSFDCAKASSRTERLICSNPLLSALDDAMGEAYETALRESPGADVRTEQRRWLTKRNACADVDCLDATYRTRLAELLHPAAVSGPAPLFGTWAFANERFGTFTFTPTTFTWGACKRVNYRVLRRDGSRYAIEVDAPKTCLSPPAKGMYLYLVLDAGGFGMWFRDCPSEEDLSKVEAGSEDSYCSQSRAGKR